MKGCLLILITLMSLMLLISGEVVYVKKISSPDPVGTDYLKMLEDLFLKSTFSA